MQFAVHLHLTHGAKAPPGSAGVETKSIMETKVFLKIWGLDTSRDMHAGLLDHRNSPEI